MTLEVEGHTPELADELLILGHSRGSTLSVVKRNSEMLK